MPCQARYFAKSSPECLVSIVFSCVIVTTRMVLARCRTGRASATARAAARLKSQATPTTSRGKELLLFGTSGKTIVGRSAEHTSELQSLMRISYAVLCLKKKTNRQQLLICNHLGS